MGAEINLRVLIFEDNKFIRCALKDFLYELGYEVFTFQDPVASPLYEKSYCDCPSGKACTDIIISDVNMPFVNGLDFIKSQIQKGCKVKSRALMSGDWTNASLQSALNLGCQIFHKPFDIREIVQWIDNCQKRIDPLRELSDWSGIEEAFSVADGTNYEFARHGDSPDM